MSNKTILGSITIFVLLVLIGAVPAGAQSIFLEPNTGPSLHLEALRPSVGSVDFSFFSYAFYLSGRVKIGETAQLRFEIPYASYKLENSLFTETGRSSFGNPYVGAEFGPRDRGVQGEVGIRLPVMSDSAEAAGFGILADPVERVEAYLHDILSVYAGLSYRHRAESGFAMMLRAVPVAWIYTGDRNADSEITVLHSAQAWYEAEKVAVGAGLSGRFLVTADGADLGQRTLYQLGFFANFDLGTFLPGFQVRIPLDDDLTGDLRLDPSYSISLGLEL